jgi:hypothetical protein
VTAEASYGRFFAGTPFAITASRETAACWAGRADIKAKLERLCRSYASRPDSSLDMVWANLGAGKSHALYHMMLLLEATADGPKPVCAYVEMPQQPRSFLDLYRQIVAQLPIETIVPHLLRGDNRKLDENLRRAAQVLAHGGGDEKRLATEWLVGDRPHLRDLRTATGIGSRIEDDLHACAMLGQIVSGLAAHRVRTVVLIDEFQRVASSSPKQRDAILQNLRSLFSKNAVCLSLVLAAGTRMEKTALELLPRELRTLMGMRPTISLPKMSEDEALEFLIDRLACFRPGGYEGAALAPFGEESLRAIVAFVGSDSERLIPRKLLQAAAWVYDGALANGTDEIGRSECERLLTELQPEE